MTYFVVVRPLGKVRNSLEGLDELFPAWWTQGERVQGKKIPTRNVPDFDPISDWLVENVSLEPKNLIGS